MVKLHNYHTFGWAVDGVLIEEVNKERVLGGGLAWDGMGLLEDYDNEGTLYVMTYPKMADLSEEEQIEFAKYLQGNNPNNWAIYPDDMLVKYGQINSRLRIKKLKKPENC